MYKHYNFFCFILLMVACTNNKGHNNITQPNKDGVSEVNSVNASVKFPSLHIIFKDLENLKNISQVITQSEKHKNQIDSFTRETSHLLLRVKRGELLITLEAYFGGKVTHKVSQKITAYGIAAVRYYLGTEYNIHRNNFKTMNSEQHKIKQNDKECRVIVSFIKK